MIEYATFAKDGKNSYNPWVQEDSKTTFLKDLTSHSIGKKKPLKFGCTFRCIPPLFILSELSSGSHGKAAFYWTGIKTNKL